MADIMMQQNSILSNLLESEENDPWPSNGNRKNNNERFSLFQDYLGLSNLLNTVKISDDNPLLCSSQKNIAFLQRARRGSWGSDGSDNAAVLSPTMRMENEYILPPPGMRLTKSIREHINGAFSQPENSKPMQPQTPSPPAQSPPAPGLSMQQTPQLPSRTNQQQQQQQPVHVCVFCRNNGESESVYTSHVLKDPEGRTSCPILRAYTCPICKANGDNSHTIKYCPLNQNARLMMSQHGNNNPQSFGPRNQPPMPPRPNGFRPPHHHQVYYRK